MAAGLSPPPRELRESGVVVWASPAARAPTSASQLMAIPFDPQGRGAISRLATPYDRVHANLNASSVVTDSRRQHRPPRNGRVLRTPFQVRASKVGYLAARCISNSQWPPSRARSQQGGRWWLGRTRCDDDEASQHPVVVSTWRASRHHSQLPCGPAVPPRLFQLRNCSNARARGSTNARKRSRCFFTGHGLAIGGESEDALMLPLQPASRRTHLFLFRVPLFFFLPTRPSIWPCV